MARLRVFVSSTCYDLDVLRSELRPFMANLGYDPVMSEYSDVLFDPRSHTHDSCIKEVPGCDMVLLIVGSRFGGTAIPAALDGIDFTFIQQTSTKPDILLSKEKLSITQLEVLKAIEQGIPVYAFVDDKVLHDHHVYERNKDKKGVIDQLDFPSIQKRETAKYIFEFINFLGHRATNNGVIGFTRLEEIRLHLLSQWSQLFQRLLHESRTKTAEAKRYRDFSERIDDLKALVLASVATPGLRDTAKGALQFRHLIAFVSGLRVDHRAILLSQSSWEDVLMHANIVGVWPAEDVRREFRHEFFFECSDGTFYRVRYPRRALADLATEWVNFTKLDAKVREAIVDALLGDREMRGPNTTVRYFPEQLTTYLSERAERMQVDFNEPAETRTASLSEASPEAR
ncbi:MAG: DUF4062 domain-containing protein [Gemmatimonadales bacterium]